MKTKNMMVSVLAGLLVVALWYTMLLKPIKAKTSKVHTDTTDAQSRLSPLQSQLSRAQADAAHASTFDAQLKSLQQAMPTSPALAAFIRDMNDISAQSGVAWQSVTHGPPTPGAGGSMSIAVGIQIRGTYGQVLDYLARLAVLRRLVVVDNVQLTSAGATGPSGAGAAGGSTGPFTGGSQLLGTLSARMFQGTSIAAVSSGAGVSAASSGRTPSGVNNN